MKMRIKKPENVYERPSWVGEMDKFDGQVINTYVFNMTLADDQSYTYFRYYGYYFNQKWLVPVVITLDESVLEGL